MLGSFIRKILLHLLLTGLRRNIIRPTALQRYSAVKVRPLFWTVASDSICRVPFLYRFFRLDELLKLVHLPFAKIKRCSRKRWSWNDFGDTRCTMLALGAVLWLRESDHSRARENFETQSDLRLAAIRARRPFLNFDREMCRKLVS